MATIAGEAPYEERSLFVRKATGLVRGWSVHDAFIYATFSINLITLGLYIFSFGPFIPKGSLLLAVILSGAYLVFQTIVYARSEEHTSELQSRRDLVCRLLLEKKKNKKSHNSCYRQILHIID